MHPSEVAAVKHKAAWNGELAIPTVAPGTLAEANALADIDDARRQEQRELAGKAKRPVVRLA